MPNRDDLPLPADHGKSVEMRIKAPVFLVPASATQPLSRLPVEIENRTPATVVNLLTEVEQFANDVLRNAPLLEAGAGMLGKCKHDFPPPFTQDGTSLQSNGLTECARDKLRLR